MKKKKLGKYIHTIEKMAHPLIAFFIGTIFTCMAYGLLSSVLALRLTTNGVSTFAAGIILSVYYVGYIFASLSSDKVINRVGHIRAFSAYISILSALVLGHALSPNPIYWGVLRLLEGYCLGSAFMCLESWLNTRSNNRNRGVIMSMYMVTSYLGAGLGQLMLNVPDNSGFIIYILVSAIYSVALVPISLTALPSPKVRVHQDISIFKLYKISPLAVLGCIVSGVFVGTFYTLGAIYTTQIGLSLKQTSLFMSFGVFGGLLAQMPLGRISDKMDRRFLLMWICCGIFLISPWIQAIANEGDIALITAALLLGCGTFTMYPISVSHVNDLISNAERIHASGMLIMLQSLGMIFGPIIISLAMQYWGSNSFLLAYSITAGAYVLFALKQIVFHPKINYINPSPTAPTPLAPTHMFNELSQDDTLMEKAKDIFGSKQEY